MTIYIVFFVDKMLFAFDTIAEAESYIRACNHSGTYSPERLYWRSVDKFPS